MSRVTIYFVQLAKDQIYGSTRMRSTELIEMISPHLPDHLEAKLIVMPKGTHPIAQRIWAHRAPKDAIYVLTKQAAKKLTRKAGLVLKSRARALCFDYVDGDPREFLADLADVHICSSFAQENALKQLQDSGQFATGATHVILHNASIEFVKMNAEPAKTFAAAYFGAPEMTYVPEALKNDVAIINAGTVNDFKMNFARLPDYALHYCFRKSHEASELVVKPFTKGVIAAYCHANLITSRNVWDAERLLGSDYPFLVDDNSEENILTAYETAKSSFGTPVWRDALDSMTRLRDMVSGPSLARSFVELANLAGVE